jgi:hypothetical protein
MEAGRDSRGAGDLTEFTAFTACLWIGTEKLGIQKRTGSTLRFHPRQNVLVLLCFWFRFEIG